MHRYWFLLLTLMPALMFGAENPNIHEYELDNGLKLIVKEDHRAPMVFSSIWYKVGGSYEPRGMTGISHALEHMMFRGTQKVGPGELAKLVNAAGGQQNAMTSDDFTVYFQTLPADQLSLSFQLESDRMNHLTLDQNAFAKEIQIVMEERRMRTEDDPQALTMERFNAIAYINNPYTHPVVGWMSDLQQMTVQDLRNWYQQWYAPNNATIIVVGDVQPDQVFSLAKQYFASTPKKTLPALKQTEEVSALGTRRLTARLPAQLSWILLGYNAPVLKQNAKNNDDPYALVTLAYLLGGGKSARFNQNLVRGQQAAVSASADYDPYHLHDTLFIISATPTKKTSLQQLQTALQNEVKKLQDAEVGADELKRTKALLIAQHVFGQDSLTTQAVNLGLPEMTGLSWRFEDEFIARIEAVTAAQIQAAAKKYLTAETLTVGELEPIAKPNASSSPGEPHDHSSLIQ